jgi:hypothetical protein
MTITRGTPGTTTGDLNVTVSAVPEPKAMLLIRRRARCHDGL